MTPLHKKILDVMFKLREKGETMTTGSIAEAYGVTRATMGWNLQSMYERNLVTKMGLLTQWYSTNARNKQMMWNVNIQYLRVLEQKEIESAKESSRPPQIMFKLPPKKGAKRVSNQQVRNTV